MQRLFSSFAEGWPGAGLLMLRLLASAALLHSGFERVLTVSHFTTVIPQIVGIGSGILLLVGLWTPAAGAIAAIVGVWAALSTYSSHPGDTSSLLVQSILGAVLAMVGPGCWSIDARIYGRKRIDIPEPRRNPRVR